MKKISLILLVLAVSLVFAQIVKATNKVKSKKGEVNLVSAVGGSQVVCTASFNDEMTILKRQYSYALVEGSCGQGWVKNYDVEKVWVFVDPYDRDFILDSSEVLYYMECQSSDCDRFRLWPFP